MRSGIELLFLPRRMGRMPYGFAAKRVGGPDARITILRIRHAYNHRCAVRQDSLRLALPLRHGAGSAVQDTSKEKNTAALLGGIPLLALNEELRSVIGWLFTWKLFLLVVIITGSILMFRPFCRYLCPLGAIYGLMNPVSLVRMRVSKSRCVGCGACQKACGLDIPVYKEPNSTDCIRCGKCVTVCPHNALKLDVSLKGKRKRRARQEDADA